VDKSLTAFFIIPSPRRGKEEPWRRVAWILWNRDCKSFSLSSLQCNPICPPSSGFGSFTGGSGDVENRKYTPERALNLTETGSSPGTLINRRSIRTIRRRVTLMTTVSGLDGIVGRLTGYVLYWTYLIVSGSSTLRWTIPATRPTRRSGYNNLGPFVAQ